MSVPKRVAVLFGPTLRSAVQQVLKGNYLGTPDQERLQAIVELSVAEKLPLATCLQKLYPGQSEATAQSNLRGFRKRLNDACTEAQLPLRFHADSGTRTPAAERRCWFTGRDPLVESVEKFSADSTADVTRKHLVPAKGIPQAFSPDKRLVRFFVSYAHADMALANQLMEELRRQFKPSLRYELDLWADRRIWADERIGIGEPWHTEIQRALDECDFGLLLVSPAFLGSRYISTQELPRFVGDAKETTRKPVVPIGLLPVNFEEHDLKGLQPLQIFLRHVGGTKPDRFFGDCGSKHEKRKFTEELFQDIVDRLDKWFGPEPARPVAGATLAENEPLDEAKPDTDPIPRPDPRARDHFAANAAGERPKNLVPARGFPATHRDVEQGSAGAVSDKQATEAVPFICSWAKRSDDSPFLAVLGEYGMGKTTALQEATRVLLAERAKGDLSVPLPIYFDLRLLDLGDKSRVPVLDEILADLLRRSWKLTDRTCPLTPSDILRVVREEQAVVIFDGLDEKLVHLTPDRGGQFIRELWSILPPALLREKKPGRGKVILSCRSHYFRDVWAQRAALCGEDREGMDPDRDYRLFLMLPFTEKQIRHYLALTLRQPGDTDEQAQARGDTAFDLIASIHNLTELASRPYLLSLISSELESLEELRLRGETVNAARLYDLVVRRWLGRDDGKHQLNPAHKRELMEHLAAAMWADGSKEWDADRLEEWLDGFLAGNPRLASAYANKDRDVLKEDLRTATFVLRPDTSKAGFRFAHTSLQEFFLALFLARALREDRPTAWRLPAPSEETLVFVGQLLELETRRNIALATLARILGGAGDSADAASLPLAALNAFRYWLRAVRSAWPAQAPTHVHLPHADLEDWQIIGPAEGPPLNLRGACLTGAKLSRTRMERVDLAGADLTGATARQSLWLEVTAPEAQLAGADLCGQKWRKGSLARATLVGAKLAGAQWIQVDLADCKLPPSWEQEAAVATHPPTPSTVEARLLALSGHSHSVLAVAWSPDGQRLLSGSSDKSLKVWDARSGELLLTLSGHSYSVSAVAWSPDGHRLLSGSYDKSLKVWDARSGELLLTLSGHSNSVLAVAWSPDGQRLLSGSSDNSLKVWDARSGELLLTLSGHSNWVDAVAWSPDGQRLLSGSYDNSLKVWDARSGELLLTLSGHSNWVDAVAWSPDGQRLLSGSSDNSLKVWDARSGELLLTLCGHSNSVRAVAWSPDGHRLLSGSYDNSLKVWDARSGELLLTLSGHSYSVSAVAWSPDGQRLLSGSYDNSLKVWDARSGELLLTLSGHSYSVSAVAWSPDGHRLLSGSSDKSLKVWDARSGELLLTLSGHSYSVSAVAWSPDGHRLLSGSYDKSLKVWDARSGELLLTLSGHSNSVLAVAWSPDGQRLLSGSSDNSLKVWDARSGELLLTLSGHSNSVRAVAWSPDGHRLLSGSYDNSLKVWDARSGELLLTLSGHSNWVDAVAWSPDGQRLLSGSYDNSLKVWDARSGELLLTLSGHSYSVSAVAWSPDGQRLLSGSSDNSLKVWDARSGELLLTLSGHSNSVRAVAWSPDGHRLLSGSSDNSLKVWDARSGELLWTGVNLPELQTAALNFENNRILNVTPEAWRFLGWRQTDPVSHQARILPAEAFGPLPSNPSNDAFENGLGPRKKPAVTRA